MNPELDKKLCEEFPVIFQDRNKSPRETAMCWGCSCGDGWYELIRKTCFLIEQRIRNRNQNIEWTIDFNTKLSNAFHSNNWSEWPTYSSKEYRIVPDTIHPVIATQIKEKFGGLRFYYDGGDDYVQGVVDMAEEMSYRICEECGDAAEVDSNGGWVRTRCSKHQ